MNKDTLKEREIALQTAVSDITTFCLISKGFSGEVNDRLQEIATDIASIFARYDNFQLNFPPVLHHDMTENDSAYIQMEMKQMDLNARNALQAAMQKQGVIELNGAVLAQN